MKMKPRVSLFITAISLSLFASMLVAHAQPPHCGPKARGAHGMIEKLDLSDDQQVAFQSLSDRHPRERSSAMNERQQVRDLVRTGQVDEAAELASTLASERVRAMADRRAEIASILTDDQLAQLDEMTTNCSHRGKRFHRGPRPE